MKRKCVQMLLVILSIFLFSTGFAQNDSRYNELIQKADADENYSSLVNCSL
jgi:hypothetical protein